MSQTLPPTTIMLGKQPVSRLILGGNPFSGGSHQGPQKDREMALYFTAARIKETLRQAEALGVSTLIARIDRHIMRLLLEYWDEGGRITWIAQTAPEYGSVSANIAQAIANGAKGIYLHGGQMDYWVANGQTAELPAAIAQIHAAGLPAGVAGHKPATHLWAAQNLPIDFHMCSYYNPTPRDTHAEHRPEDFETFAEEDRAAMTACIAQLSRPVIHYKIFAAGRNDPRAAFAVLGRHLRPGDATCIGVFPKYNPNMLADDLAMFNEIA